jgi:hypothetical protein
MLKSIYGRVAVVMAILLSAATAAFSDEFIGRYHLYESYISSSGERVLNADWVYLWKIDGSDNLRIQFINEPDDEQSYLIQYFDDSSMYFEKNNKLYLLNFRLGCDDQLIAAGNILGVNGLCQLWVK